VFCVAYSADNRFVMSGSDDTNIRVWKARASEKMGKVCTFLSLVCVCARALFPL